jgi:hypothetical protein
MRTLVVLHIVATLYVARWTLFGLQISTTGSLLFLVPFQITTVACLCGLVVAVTVSERHWARRHLVGLNIASIISLLLWNVGPLYRSFRHGQPWGEVLVAILLVGGLILGVSLRVVRRTFQMSQEREDLSNWTLLVLSIVICLLGSSPWLFKVLQATDSFQGFHEWTSSLSGIMELATISAIAISGCAVLNGAKLATVVSITEAVFVPIVMLLAGR